MEEMNIKKVTDIDGNKLDFATPKTNMFARAVGANLVEIPKLSSTKDTIIYIYFNEDK